MLRRRLLLCCANSQSRPIAAGRPTLTGVSRHWTAGPDEAYDECRLWGSTSIDDASGDQIHGVKRTAYRAAAELQHVGVDHGGRHIGVPEKILHGSDIVAGLEQVCRECMPEAVRSGRLGDAAAGHCTLEGALKRLIEHVVTTYDAGSGINGVCRLGKDPKPRP